MAKLPRISEAEWEVMRVLWARGESTAAEVLAELKGRAGWKPTTVKTLLSRLVAKRAAGYTPRGKEYVYRPLVSESAVVRAETGSFVDRVFGGALAPMLAHFVDDKRLSTEEIAELRQILDRAERDNKGK